MLPSESMIGVPFERHEVVRVGIVGTGLRGRSVLHELLGVDNVRITALCDVVPDKAAMALEMVRKAGHDYPVAVVTSGERGLPLMRGGDWNDGMDRVGALGRGESVWLGFFLARVLSDGAELAAITLLTEPLEDFVAANYAGHYHVDYEHTPEDAGYDVFVTDALWDDVVTVRVVEVWGDAAGFEYVQDLVEVP